MGRELHQIWAKKHMAKYSQATDASRLWQIYEKGEKEVKDYFV